MMWSRWRHALLVAALLACAPLGWLASGAGRLGRGGLASMVDLSLAGSAEAARIIVQGWREQQLVPVAVGALLWDLPFIAALVLAAGLTAMALARPLPGRLARLGLAAAAGAMLAGAADVVEDVLLLLVLDGDTGSPAGAAAWLARLKLALWGGALLLLAAQAVVRLRHRPARPGLPAWRTPKVTAASGDLLRCDLVMKGGITSGVVYPGAVWALSKRYRFMSIGGSSAGAIAASVTAAAEYRRQAGGGEAGFEALRATTAELAGEDALFHLFQPAPACAPLFDVVAAALRPGPVAVRFLWGAWTAVAAFPLASLAGLLPALLAGWAAASPPSAATAAWVYCTGAAASALGLVVSLAVAAGRRAAVRLPGCGFGLCPGPTQGAGAVGAGLSDWLADRIDQIAFGDDWKARGPLTLGHLWCGGPPDQERVAAVRVGREEPAVRFEVLATSLTHGRPYRIPFDNLPLWFRRSDLRRVLPKRVVRAMVRARGQGELPKGLSRLPRWLVPLPAAADLPVVFLARMSLSFPVLLSAPRLMGLRYVAADRPELDTGGPDADGEAGRPEAAAPWYQPSFEPHWFSDGGISSNFPVHFFDQPIPAWPTFGLDLGTVAPGKEDGPRAWLPHKNDQGIGAPWRTVEGVVGFGGAVFSSLHAWLDNLQKRAPGYRDRIARIDLTEEEGGLNLRMPPELVRRVAGFGNDAGVELADRFEPRAAGAPPPPARGRRSDAPGWAWDNHRWVRFRSTLSLLERFIHAFGADVRKVPVAPTPAYDDLIGAGARRSPSYAFSDDQLVRAEALVKELRGICTAEPSLAEGAPRPVPELRIIPKV